MLFAGEELASASRNIYSQSTTGKTVQGYNTVRFRGVYSGTDLLYRASQGAIEYEFDLSPGARPERIQFRAMGATGIELVNGSLVVRLDDGVIRHRAPIAHQEIDGKRKTVEVAFELRGEAIGFRVGAYDARYTLVIDPVITYSSYLGGTGIDNGRAVATDAAGNIYIAGETNSTDFPSQTVATLVGQQHVFVTKMRSDGTVVYTTILASSARDSGAAIAVGVGGDVYVAGLTTGTNFPVTAAAYKKVAMGQGDAFVTHLDASGKVLYSTYLGGSGTDAATGIAVDTSGNVYVTGSTASFDFPVSGPASQSYHGGYGDAFLAKLNPAGTALIYSTMVGGSGLDVANALSLGPANVCIGGLTQSADMVVVNPYQRSAGGLGDGFIACMRNDGAAWSVITYLGVLGYDDITGIAQDNSSNIYVTGTTLGGSSLATAGAYQTTLHGDREIFIAKFIPTAAQIVYFTLLGGGGMDASTAIAVDSLGQAWVTGLTYSLDFPAVKADYAQSMGGADAFVTQMSANGDRVLLSTRYGGVTDDRGNAIAVTSTGDAIVVGSTNSSNLSGASASSRPTLRGFADGFVARIHPAPVVVTTFTISGVVTFSGGGLAGVTLTPTGSTLPAVVTPGSGSYSFAGLPANSSYTVTPFLASYRFSPTSQTFGSLAANQVANFVAYKTTTPGDFDGNGVPDLIWQNDTGWQIGTWLFNDPLATTVIGYTYPQGAIDPYWDLITVADFNGDGVMDVVWQNRNTRMVAVWFMTGPQGSLQATVGIPATNPGWKLVSCVDVDRNGTPDLVWQNDTTRAVSVWYMGGPMGMVLLGTASLAPDTYPGWTVVGMADFDRNGVPDLVWQNDSLRTVRVWYMGGAQGTTLLGTGFPASGTYPGWRIIELVDLNRDGIPDLVWQNDSSRQVGAWYMGGPQGTVQLGTSLLAPGTYEGWRAVGPR